MQNENNAPNPRLSSLYQEVILDHNKSPRNFKKIEKPSAYSHGYNPLCGDDYHLYLVVNAAGEIEDIGFEGSGCAISKASASMMTSMVKGRKVSEVYPVSQGFLEMMTTASEAAEYKEKIGRLTMFSGVREFPIRVKCATLIWHSLEDALKDLSKTSNT